MLLAAPAVCALDLPWPGEKSSGSDQGLHPPGWADLPPELLHLIVTAAQRELCTPPCGPPAGSHVPRHGQPPSLAQAAALRAAVECCCRGWRAGMRVQAAPPLHLALGRSAMTAGERAAPLCRWLARLPAATLHFEASQLPGCGSGAMQQLALDVVGSEELRAASATTLTELAAWDYLCSRPLCALLPRFAALRSLALTGYQIDLDLEPLSKLPRLAALHVEAEALPRLPHSLPCSLRHLSLASFANAARVSLPRCPLLESLVVECPSQGVFLALNAALAQCRAIRVRGRSIRLLLHVDAAAVQAADPAAALLHAFGQAARARQLELQAGELRLKVAPHAAPGAAAAVPAAGQRLRPLDPRAVCVCAAASSGVDASLEGSSEATRGGGSGGGTGTAATLRLVRT